MTRADALLALIKMMLERLEKSFGDAPAYTDGMSRGAVDQLLAQHKRPGEGLPVAVATVIKDLPEEMQRQYRENPEALGRLEAGRLLSEIAQQSDPTTGEPLPGSLLAALKGPSPGVV
jgi:hypothetical protein